MKNSGQFFTAEVFKDGKWVNRTYFPKNWTMEEIEETLEEVWKNKELIGVAGDYIIFQGLLQGHINMRYIASRSTGEIHYNYPMFDISLTDNDALESADSLFGRLKQRISDHFSSKEEKFEMTDAMEEQFKNQLLMNFRRIVMNNEMDCSIKLTFIHEKDGQKMVDEHYMGPYDAGQIPYFIGGTLTVWHENNVASVDISDVKNEYVFTVHADGSISQVTQETNH
ncbi:MAG: hypothetical protein AB7F19_03435 [Candidatus Babeliales bacterium]